MNFKIYQNQLGVTVFDDYIDTLNNIIDSKIYNFFQTGRDIHYKMKRLYMMQK